jgi:putative phage-type endonuclease
MINKDLILNVEQGSDEWLKARLGVITASEFGKIITPSGSKSASANEYMGKLIAEHLTGEQQDNYCSHDMARGNELESKARLFFEVIKGKEAHEVGMVYKDSDKNIACSPDGLIAAYPCMDTPQPPPIGCEDGSVQYLKGLEIKCPKLANHISYVISDQMPKKYIPQVQGSIWTTGVDGWWFMSYHPDYKPLIIFVERDNEYIEKMEKIILSFSGLLQIHKEKL